MPIKSTEMSFVLYNKGGMSCSTRVLRTRHSSNQQYCHCTTLCRRAGVSVFPPVNCHRFQVVPLLRLPLNPLYDWCKVEFILSVTRISQGANFTRFGVPGTYILWFGLLLFRKKLVGHRTLYSVSAIDFLGKPLFCKANKPASPVSSGTHGHRPPWEEVA